MPAKECWVLEALMEQPLPQLLLQRQLPPHPRAGLQEGQMSDPLPLRLLVHLDRRDLGPRPVPRAQMEAHLAQQQLMLFRVEELTYVGIDKPAYAQKML